MNWFWYVLIAINMANVILTIAGIGAQRRPIGKDDAIISLILSALIIAGIFHYAR